MSLDCFRRLAGVACVLLCGFGPTVWAQDDGAAAPTLAELRAKADRGDVRAMVEVAQRYDWGNDGETEQDFAEARAWYEKAAAKGDVYAGYQIAGMLKEGRGVAADATQAFSWMKRAAEAGLAAAQLEVAAMHENGEGTPKNLVEALRWFEKAAVLGDAEGMYRAGLAHTEGRGTKKDVVAGAKWLQRASQNWHEEAGAKLWELRGADPELGAKMIAAAGPELKKLIAGAEAGDAKAQVALAEKLQAGDSEILSDLAEAMKWWAKAAEQGAPEALTELGRRSVLGEGVDRDLAKAIELLKKAAERKFAAAYFWLAAAHDDYAEEANPAEAAKTLAPVWGLDTAIVETANARRSYQVRTLDPADLSEQQRIADTFFAEGLLPKEVKATDAEIWSKNEKSTEAKPH